MTIDERIERLEHADEWSRGICTICGGPEPCSKRQCIEALMAQADYWEDYEH